MQTFLHLYSWLETRSRSDKKLVVVRNTFTSYVFFTYYYFVFFIWMLNWFVSLPTYSKQTYYFLSVISMEKVLWWVENSISTFLQICSKNRFKFPADFEIDFPGRYGQEIDSRCLQIYGRKIYKFPVEICLKNWHRVSYKYVG